MKTKDGIMRRDVLKDLGWVFWGGKGRGREFHCPVVFILKTNRPPLSPSAPPLRVGLRSEITLQSMKKSHSPP